MNTAAAEPTMAEVHAAELDLLDLGIKAQAFSAEAEEAFSAEAEDGAESNKEKEDSEAAFIAKFVLNNETFMRALQDPGKPPAKGKLTTNFPQILQWCSLFYDHLRQNNFPD